MPIIYVRIVTKNSVINDFPQSYSDCGAHKSLKVVGQYLQVDGAVDAVLRKKQQEEFNQFRKRSRGFCRHKKDPLILKQPQPYSCGKPELKR